MTEQEKKLKAMLESSPAGAKAAANLDGILGKVDTNSNVLKDLKNTQAAQKAMSGDTAAMAEVMKNLMSSKEGLDLINQVKKATEE